MATWEYCTWPPKPSSSSPAATKRDVKALEEVMLRLSQLIEDIPEVAELDLNPVMVLREGKGAVVVDARVRVAESTPQLPIGAKKR